MTKTVSLAILLALMASLLGGTSCCNPRDTGALRVGVLLPITGLRTIHSDDVLNWAADNINQNGGINKRRIELVYKDTTAQDISQLAQELIDDESIKMVIGPCRSDEVYRIAPMFIQNEKICLSR